MVLGLPTAGHAGRQRRHLARGVPAHARRRGGPRGGGDGGLRVRRGPAALDRAVGAGLRRAAGPLGDVRRHARRRARRRPAHRRPPARLRRAHHHGPAQDHQRRLAQHPHRLVLRAVRRRAPAGAPCGSAEPLRRRAARPARARPPRRPRGGHPRHRGRGRGRGAGGVRRHRCARLDRARADGRQGRRTPDGRARRPGQRATGPSPRRPRHHRAGLVGPGRALLRVPVDAATRASSSPSVPTHRSRRSTRGWPSRPPCTAAPTNGTRGTASRR